MRQRMAADLLPQLESEGVDPDLIEKALDSRFNEVLLSHFRRSAPGLLPEDKQPEFQDPDWDKREDAVPTWVPVFKCSSWVG